MVIVSRYANFQFTAVSPKVSPVSNILCNFSKGISVLKCTSKCFHAVDKIISYLIVLL